MRIVSLFLRKRAILQAGSRVYCDAPALALAFVVLLGMASPASAFLFGWGDPPGGWYRYPRPPQSIEPRERRRGHEPRHRRRSAQPSFPKAKPLSAAEQRRHDELLAQAKGKLLLMAISLDEQQMVLYADGVEIARTPISSGTRRHPTPAGIFSVIQKRRFHRSNLYSNAPMPFMQRLTWDGIALHQGVLPGYPASHGCIRLPEQFARMLFVAAKIGARVTVTHAPAPLYAFAHPRLFTAKPKVAQAPNARPVQLAAATTSASDASSSGRGEADLASRDDDVMRAVHLAIQGAMTADAAAADDAASRRTDTGAASEPQTTSQAARTAEAGASLRAGPITVFVSRKTSRLYVRKGFAPVFDVPIEIERPAEPLGTHLFTAVGSSEDETTLRWMVQSMPSHPVAAPPPRPAAGKKGRKVAQPESRPAPDVPGAAPALERITIPPETIERISALMTPGASFIVSDHGPGSRTGKETDFTIVTR